MFLPLRKSRERAIEVGPLHRGRSEPDSRPVYMLGAIGIPLIGLLLVLVVFKGPFVHTSAEDPSGPSSRSDNVVVAAVGEQDGPTQTEDIATPGIENDDKPHQTEARATEPKIQSTTSSAAANAQVTPIPLEIKPTPTAEPPLVQYLADPSTIDGPLWIEVSVSKQSMVIYKNQIPILRTRVSTGQPGFESPTGVFYVQRMLRFDDMDGQFLGEDYFYPDVPWVMYFTNVGHALHGVYWHEDFGTPLSHGCVGLPLEVAEYLFDMAYVGMGMEIFD